MENFVQNLSSLSIFVPFYWKCGPDSPLIDWKSWRYFIILRINRYVDFTKFEIMIFVLWEKEVFHIIIIFLTLTTLSSYICKTLCFAA